MLVLKISLLKLIRSACLAFSLTILTLRVKNVRHVLKILFIMWGTKNARDVLDRDLFSKGKPVWLVIAVNISIWLSRLAKNVVEEENTTRISTNVNVLEISRFIQGNNVFSASYPNISILRRGSVWAAPILKSTTLSYQNVWIVPRLSLSLTERDVQFVRVTNFTMRLLLTVKNVLLA